GVGEKFDVDPAPGPGGLEALVSGEGRVREEDRRAGPHVDRPAVAVRPVPEERHVRQADGAVLSFRKRREADGAAIGGEVAGERDVEEGRVTGLDVDGGAGAAEVVLEPERSEENTSELQS